MVDTEVDDYGATSGSLDKPMEWVEGGWKVQDWKVLLPPTPVAFTPPKYDGPNEGERFSFQVGICMSSDHLLQMMFALLSFFGRRGRAESRRVWSSPTRLSRRPSSQSGTVPG